MSKGYEQDPKEPNRVRDDAQLWPDSLDESLIEAGAIAGIAAAAAGQGFIFQEGGDWFGGDRYAIVKLLGKGGQCEVWLARDRDADPDDPERFVAIKVLQSRLQIDDKAGKRLKAEALAFLGIENKNLPRVYHADVDPERNLFFYVMEYLRGETLDERIRRSGPVDLLDALRIVAEAAEAVQVIHGLGILHCDLKPENIFLTDDGRAVVLDLGVAKFDQDRFPDRSTFRTDQTSIAGTFAYMSPEQCLGDKLDVRSDVYALGIILYHCLTGFHPAQGYAGGWMPKDFRQWSGWHLNNPPKPLPMVVPWLPVSVWETVSTAIQKDREERQSSARGLAIELRTRIAVLRDTPILKPAGPGSGLPAAELEGRTEALALATTDQKGGVPSLGVALATTDPTMAAGVHVPEVVSMAVGSQAYENSPVQSMAVASDRAPASTSPPPTAAPRTPNGTEIISASEARLSPGSISAPRTARGTEIILAPAPRAARGAYVSAEGAGAPAARATLKSPPSSRTPGAQAVPIVPVRLGAARRTPTVRVVAFGGAGLVLGLGLATLVAVLSGHGPTPSAHGPAAASSPTPVAPPSATSNAAPMLAPTTTLPESQTSSSPEVVNLVPAPPAPTMRPSSSPAWKRPSQTQRAPKPALHPSKTSDRIMD